jgi:hypothetical protein
MKKILIVLTLLTSTGNMSVNYLHASENFLPENTSFPTTSPESNHEQDIADFKKKMAQLPPEIRQSLSVLGEVAQKMEKEAKKLNKRLNSVEESYNDVKKSIPQVRNMAYIGMGVAALTSLLLACHGFDRKTFFNDGESAALKIIAVAVPLLGIAGMYAQSKTQTIKFDKKIIEKSKANLKNLKNYMENLGQMSLASILYVAKLKNPTVPSVDKGSV